MFEILLKKMINRLKEIDLIENTRTVSIKPINEKEIQIIDSVENESLSPIISYEDILRSWDELVKARSLSVDQLKFINEFPIYILTILSKFPFITTHYKDSKSSVITFRQFTTDQLPAENYQHVIEFIQEIINNKYDPEKLSEQLDGSQYHQKSRCRQDLRLMGLLDEDNKVSQKNFTKYQTSQDKNLYLRKLILEQEYMKLVIEILWALEDMSKNKKRKTLIDLGMLIVRNSKGENLMLESVAKRRTDNIISWLENLDIVDNSWVPKSKELQNMDSSLREYLLKIAKEYLLAKKEPFGGHHLANFIRHNVPNEISNLPFINEEVYTVAASAGKGNWASIPWVSILNKRVTDSTQRGYYLVYLFSEKLKKLYLSFSQGVTETSKEDMVEIKRDIRGHIKMDSRVKKDDELFLGTSNRAKQYAESTAAYIEYDLNHLPPDNILVQDLMMMVTYYEEYINLKSTPQLKSIYSSSSPKGLIAYEEKSWFESIKQLVVHIQSYIRSKGFYYTEEEVTNLFLSLKTKPFVILSGISGTGKTKLVQWFSESIGATEENGRFTLIPVRPDWNDGSDLLGYTDIKGDFTVGPLTKVIERAIADPDSPYFVLLDEMNLARVEHYFSDVLSVMESRSWLGGKMVTSSLLSKEGYDIQLPVNLYIIGTVNMDETTYPFSKKVLDRANTLEFNRVELSNLSFLEEKDVVDPKIVGNEIFQSKYLYLKDVYAGNKELVQKVTDELEDINRILELTNSHVGYRVRDEICFYLAYNDDSELMEFNTAFDHCILQKILPRISGSDTRVKHLLEGLYTKFTGRKYVEGQEWESVDLESIYPKSAAKVIEMLRRLEDGFTSFWIS